MKKDWIVLADGTHARILEGTGRARPLREISVLEHPAGRLKEGELASDKPGRTLSGVNGGRHGVEERGAHQHEQTLFARDIAERLEQGRQVQRYDDLILIAAPELLGAVRASLSTPTSKHISACISKNLTDEDEATVRRYVYSEFG